MIRKQNRVPAKLLVLGVLVTTSFRTALAQQDSSPDTLLRLGDLLAETRMNNPRLRSAYLNADALSTRRDQVSALPDPTIGFMWQPYAILTARGTQRTQLRAEQMFPFPGKLRLQGDMADRSVDIAKTETETLGLDLELKVKQAYYELYRIQEVDRLVETFQETLQDFEDAAATHYKVGTGRQQAILKAQLEKNSLTQMKLDLEEKQRTAAEMLARLLNRPTSSGLDKAVRLERPGLPELDLQALFDLALRKRPEIEALNAEASRTDAQIALAKKNYWPDFGVNVTYFDIAPADMPPTANGRDALALGFSVKVPLQRGRLRASMEEARLRRLQVDVKREALETEFRTEIADLLNQLEQLEQQMTLFLETLIPQAEITLQATLSDYTTGRTDFLNLLDSERMLFSLRVGYENVYARHLKVAAALERAIGAANLAEEEQQ